MSENANENKNTADTVETDATTTVQPSTQRSSTAQPEPDTNQSTRRDERRDSAYAVVAGEPGPSAEDLKGLPGYKNEEDADTTQKGSDDDVL